MGALTIAALPFHERPVRALLHFDEARTTVDRDYAGYGWARVDRLYLATGDERGRALDDVLVLALHSADDAEPLADDIELELELPDRPPVAVLASLFLARWLPRLPRDTSAIVLALCNPHHAILRAPSDDPRPIYYAMGDVESWLERDEQGDHIRLVAPSWATLSAT